MLPAIATIPSDPAVMSLGALFGPFAVLALTAVLVTLGVLVAALVVERRERDRFARLSGRAGSVSRLDTPRSSRRVAA